MEGTNNVRRIPKSILSPMAQQKKIERLESEVAFLRSEISTLRAEVKVIDCDLHEVRPGYLKKLDKIEKGKFHSYKNMNEFMKAIGASH